ncbi:MAG: gamma-glutamylcyclotransferase family protein [Pyrinomonadaceae bacterium]
MNKHLVFVYGTLRRGSARDMSHRFPGSKFIGDAKVMGSLYDLGDYPGLLLDESNSTVIGEAYEVDEEILNAMDEFEASSNYRRKRVEISLGSDSRMCWVYEPDPEFHSPRTLIASGDWIEYAGLRGGR